MGDARDVRGLRRHAARLGGAAKATSGKQRVGAGAAVVLLATAPFGGLRAAEQPGPSAIEQGEVLTVGPYELTVDRVVTVSDLEPKLRPDTEGNRLLVVVGELRNPGVRPEYAVLLTDAIGVEGGDVVDKQRPERDAQLVTIADGVGLSEVNPGITYEVALVFEQRAGWEPGPVEVTARGYTYVEEDPLTLDDNSWLMEDDVAASGEFPVKVNP